MRRARAALWLAAALCASCGGEPATPEDEVRALLAALEAAAESRDVGDVLALVSESYRDPAGHDKQALKGVVLGYFLGHEAIHVVSRVRELELAEPPTSAHVVMSAALTGAPVTEPGELGSLSADVYRFELEAAREVDGAWRLTSARWRPAGAAELL